MICAAKRKRDEGKQGVRRKSVFKALQAETAVKDDVATPASMYDDLNELFKFTFDPCPLNGADEEGAGAGGLTRSWGTVNYVNPPFSNIPAWISKALEEKAKGNKTVMLVPLRPHTKYWRQLVQPHVGTVIFFTKRFAFQGYKDTAPMSICLLFFGFLPRELDVIPRNWQPGGVPTWRLQSWVF